MYILATTASVSGLGLAYIIAKHLNYVREATHEEIIVKVEETKSLRVIFYKYILLPILDIWNSRVKIWLYQNIEKLAKKFRIVVLRVERLLLRFTNYIRGKHEVERNGNQSEYWKNMNDFKQEINNNEDRPEGIK